MKVEREKECSFGEEKTVDRSSQEAQTPLLCTKRRM
jgi:hypothetical protein